MTSLAFLYAFTLHVAHTVARTIRRFVAVERGGHWRDRYLRCAVCHRAAPAWMFVPIVWDGTREVADVHTDRVLPCGHSLGAHIARTGRARFKGAGRDEWQKPWQRERSN